MGIETLFSHKAMRNLARYASSRNEATQAVAAKGAGSDADFKTTGTAQCVIDGTFVASLSACATIDMASTTICRDISGKVPGNNGNSSVLGGKIVADDGQFYLMITTNATGGLTGTFAYWAHNNHVAEDDAAPTLKIPYYSPDELPIGLILYDNNGLGTDMTFGTSFIQAADDTYYQLIGPALMPHVDHWDQN
jgi:hypothetical protein